MNDTHIEELREILREDYGADLSVADAAETGRRLISFFDQLHRLDIAAKKEHERINKTL